jgi:hypothetical protein
LIALFVARIADFSISSTDSGYASTDYRPVREVQRRGGLVV